MNLSSLYCGHKGLHIENINFLEQEDSAESPTIATVVDAEVIVYAVLLRIAAR